MNTSLIVMNGKDVGSQCEEEVHRHSHVSPMWSGIPVNRTASPTRIPNLSVSPAFISKLYAAGELGLYDGRSDVGVSGLGKGMLDVMSTTLQSSDIHTKSRENSMFRIQKEETSRSSKMNNMPVPGSRPCRSESP